MQDQWYGDHRDLIKWGGLLEIAQQNQLRHILQVCYYRPCKWDQIQVDEKLVDISPRVTKHFRDISLIKKLDGTIPIEILTEALEDRESYLQTVLTAIQSRSEAPGIVFLDPDTGLQPANGKSGPTHVPVGELTSIWNALSHGDVLALYQHQTNRAGKPWIPEKKKQFDGVLNTCSKIVKAPESRLKENAGLPRDVVLFYAIMTT